MKKKKKFFFFFYKSKRAFFTLDNKKKLSSYFCNYFLYKMSFENPKIKTKTQALLLKLFQLSNHF